LTDSALGPVPDGWTIGALADVADVIMGTSPPSDTYNDTGNGVPLINGPVEYGERFPLRVKWTTASVKLATAGDLIFCVRGSTTGRRVVSDGVYGLGRGVCAIRGKNGLQPFVNLLIERELPRLLAGTTGSVFPSLSAPTIKGFAIVRPGETEIRSFCSFTAPLMQAADAAAGESVKLAALRDYLLPRLLSGRVRVRDAERVAAGV
jgi:type I restriction enzyme S subunit